MVANLNMAFLALLACSSAFTGRSNTFTSCVDGVVSKGSATWVVDNRFDRCTVGFRGLGPGANAATTVSGSLHALGTALADSANIYLDCWRGVSTDGKQRVVVRGDSILRSENAGVFVRFNDGGSMTVERNMLVDNTVGVFAGTSSGMAGMVKWNVVRGDQAAMRTGIQTGNLVYPALPVTTNYRFHIHDNDIRLRGNGIWVERCDWVDVWLNRVEARPGPPTLPVPVHGGINLLAGNNVRISENTVESDGIGQGSLQTRGVYVFASSRVDVRCNTVRRAGRSFVWQGDCRPANFLGNSMQQGVEGLVMLGTPPSVPGGAPVEAIVGRQGNNNPLAGIMQPADNRWVGAGWTSHTMSIWTNSFVNNQMIVRQQAVYNPLSNGFQGGATPITPTPLPMGNYLMVTCGQGAGGNDNARAIKDKLQNVSNSNDPLAIGAKWRAEKQAYLDLKDDPALAAQDTFLSNWFANQTGTELAYAGDAKGAVDARDTMQASAYTAAMQGVIWPSALDKSVSEIQLAGGLDDSLSLVLLRQISAECMVAGGPSVNLARALLASNGEWIYYDPECVSGARTGDIQNTAAQSAPIARCWPNPTDGLLNYEIPCPEDGELTIVVSDMAGRQVFNKLILCGQGAILLPETATGISLVEFLLSDGKAWRWLVMISK